MNNTCASPETESQTPKVGQLHHFHYDNANSSGQIQTGKGGAIRFIWLFYILFYQSLFPTLCMCAFKLVTKQQMLFLFKFGSITRDHSPSHVWWRWVKWDSALTDRNLCCQKEMLRTSLTVFDGGNTQLLQKKINLQHLSPKDVFLR